MSEHQVIGHSSEIWEMLALQAIDKCEYLFAFELLQQAVERAPTKHKLLYLMAEITYVLKYNERAIYYAEASFDIFAQDTDLRNFLLLLNPEKWQDLLRNASTTKTKAIKALEGESKLKIAENGEGEDDDTNFFSKLSKGASDAMNLIQTGGISPEQLEKQKKQLAQKEKKRKEKHERKMKKEEALKIELERTERKKRTPGKPRDISVDGPARPLKPMITTETLRILEIAREGKGTFHFHDPVVKRWHDSRVAIDRAEALWLQQHQDDIESASDGEHE
jgi:hypothetical protein